MTQKVYSDEEVFGAQAAGRVYSDEEVFGKAAPKADKPGLAGEIARNAVPWLAEGVNNIAAAPFQLVAPQGSAAEFFKNNAEWWRTKQSDDLQRRLKAANQRIDEAGRDGVLPQIGAAASEYWDDPALAARLAVTNLPSMVPGLGLGKLAQVAGGAAKLSGAAQAALGLGVAGGTNAALNAGGARGDAFDDIKSAAMKRGLSEQDATELALEGSKLPAAVGAVTGFIGGRTGVEGALLGKASAGKVLGRALGATAAELGGEQVEEVLPKLTTNVVAQSVDKGRSLGQDVGRTIVETAVGAGPSSTLAGGASAYRSMKENAALAAAGGTGGTPAVGGTGGAVDADAVLGRVEPEAPSEISAAEKALRTPRALTALDRVAEIDAQLQAAPSTSDVAALQAERAGLTAAWPTTVPGQATQFSTEAGARVDGRYALIEAGDVQASHDTDLRPNPAYPKELQPRDRTRAASETQIASIVGKLDPARLGLSADAGTGAPIIGEDGLVESGNARTIALQRAYSVPGQKAEDYKAWLRQNAASFGLSEQQVDGMRQPMLVRVRTTPVDRAEFARQANASTVAAMSPLEQARADAARIDAVDDLRPDDNGDFATSRDFIRRFVGRLPATEQAGMIDASGQLSSAGYARVRNAVLAKAYGDSPVLTRMVESMDDSMRNISRALMIAAPRVAQARSLVGAGRLHAADITPDLVAAVVELERIKARGGSVADALAQRGLDGDRHTPEQRELLQVLSDNARRPRRLAEFITAYVDALEAAGDPNQGSLMGETQAPAVADLLAAAKRATAAPAPAPAANEPSSDNEWQAFALDTGTLGVPRAEMPQVKVARRGELLEFLQGRGIEHARLDLNADALKPTQAEYSRAKTDSAAHLVDEKTDRAAVLVSSDGYVLDGHHRWLARAEAHAPVWAIQLDAPIGRLLDAVMQFPGTTVSRDSAGAVTPSARDLAVSDLKLAVGELGEFLTRHMRAAFTEQDEQRVMPILVKLFDAGIRIVGTDMRRVMAWVRDHLRRNKDELPGWGSIPATLHRKAAEKALASLEERGQQMGLFGENELVQPDLFAQPAQAAEPKAAQPVPAIKAPVAGIAKGDQVAWARNGRDARAIVVQAPDHQGFMQVRVVAGPSAIVGKTVTQHVGNLRKVDQPAVAMIDGRPYDVGRDNFKPPATSAFVPAATLAKVRDVLGALHKAAAPVAISADDRARAERMLRPLIDAAEAAKAGYDQKIIDIAKSTGALGQMLTTVKSLDSAMRKLVNEVAFDSARMYDMLRSTIVVSKYADAQAVLDAIRSQFDVVPGRIKNTTDAVIDGKAGRFADSGYGQVLVNVALPGGVIAEIQINVPEMLAVKLADGHALYEVERAEKDGSQTKADAVALQAELYPLAAAAAAARSDASLEPLEPGDSGKSRAGVKYSRPVASFSPKTRPSGNLTNSIASPLVPNEQPGGNLSGTLIDLSMPASVGETATNGYTGSATESSHDASERHDRAGDARDRADTSRQVEEGGRVAVAPAGAGGRDQRPGGRGIGANEGPGAPAAPAAGRDHERARGAGAGSRSGAGAGVPAGRHAGQRHRERSDVPGDVRPAAAVQPAGRDLKPKTGRNYRFTDDDISPRGSWIKRAEWNVDAVELIRRLEAEKRQATADEQRVLARFVGWGASDIANNLFGDKLDKQAQALRDYDEAIEALGDREFLDNANYSRYLPAFNLLQAKNPALNWYTAGRITKAMLDDAKPPASVARWVELRDRLRKALTVAEYAEAQRSTQYGHYTSAPIVRGMWAAMQRFGFKGGLVFEPGAGKGNFPGLMPEALAANSSYTGVEYDSITGAILRQLFPDEQVRVESFVDTKLPRDFFDVAIGNPPFAGLSVLSDPEYKRHAFKLHDYFFAKSIDRVRPGGMLMFVTSRYTMDKAGDKARQYLAERADLVGAIRLPQTAFKENAGTEVVTDVLFLRKKVPGETFEHGQPWGGVVPAQVDGQPLMVSDGEGKPDKPALINEYFAAHPEMVLGVHANVGSMYAAKEYTVIPAAGDIGEAFAAAAARMPADILHAAHGSAAEAAQVREIDFDPKAQKEGNYYVNGKGILMQREQGVGRAVLGMPKGDEAIVRSFVPLRDALKQAQHDQLNGGDWESSLAALQAEYRRFVAAHGRINQFKMRDQRVKVDVLDENGEPTGEKEWGTVPRPVYTLRGVLQDDPEWTLVSSLESVNEDAGEISDGDALSKRVLGGEKPRDITTPHDAMLSVLDELGRVDIAAIADRLGMDADATIAALGSAIYRDPDGEVWETADAYLSGNVREKLVLAQAVARTDGAYERNVEALRSVQPAPKGPSSINVAIGMNWIPGADYGRFLKEVAGVDAEVHWNDATRQWSVQFTGTDRGGIKASHKRDRATVEWGTADRHAGELLEHALTGRQIVIRRRVVTASGATEVTDNAAIEAANAKLEALKARFAEWVWEDAQRAEFLVRTYNEKFNAIAPRVFDGRHLTLPGTSSLFNVFDHVKRGAWRVIQSGNTYLAHAVGSGKTFEMVISAMEQKRLGLIKKPMIVVPNHMLRQFSAEWLQLYPAARLMVADENAFHKDKRRQFVSRVALSDLDGVVITHDAFKLLDIDPAFRRKIVDEQLDFLRAALNDIDGEGADGKGRKSLRVKQIERQIEQAEEKLKAAQKADKKDQNARFDELGVDMLYVDEAHLFRKLAYGTSRQVKGISSEGSDRAMDLYTKARWLDEKNPGRSLVLASGTPITNTLAELYSVMRFLGRKELAEDGMEDFDSWAAQYGRAVTALEANAAGKYEPVTRFAKFVNVPALIQRFKQFADVLTADNLAALLGDKRPKVQGGSRQIVVTPKTTRFRLNQRALAARFEASRNWKPSKDEPNNPDPIIKIIGDGRLAAIDMRFVDPGAKNDPQSKLNRMIDGVIAAYKEGADRVYTDKKTGEAEPNMGSTMMVFSDLGFGAGVAASRGFNARAWMEKRLRDEGIPIKHLAFMSDHKSNDAKKKLFGDMNAGRVRILVGSSKNMGTGVNAQQRLLDLFHLDTPWFPADLEQREGRIVRQGNKNPEVRIHAFATKGSYDETMWGMLARKAMFIGQAMEGDPNVDEIEDLDSQSQYELAAAMTADDPRVLQLAGINAEIGKLERLKQAHEGDRARFVQRFRDASAEADANERLLPAAEKAAANVRDLSGDKFAASVTGKKFSERKAWGAALMAAARHLASGVERSQNIGEVSGFDVTFRSKRTDSSFDWWVTLDTPVPSRLIDAGDETGVQIAMQAQNAVTRVAKLPAVLRDNIERQRNEADALRPRLESAFPMAEMLAGKRREAAALLDEIASASQDRRWIATRLDTGEPFPVMANSEEAAIDSAMADHGGEPEVWRVVETPVESDASSSGATDQPVLSVAGAGAGGISVAALQAVAERITAKLEGLRGKVHVLASPADLPAGSPLRAFIEQRGAAATVEGAVHEGEVYLFASGIADEARAEHVLAEHEAAHAGLRGLMDAADLRRSMQAIYNTNLAVRRAAKTMVDAGMAEHEAAEEVLVDMPTSELAKLQGWRALVGRLRDGLRARGFARLADAIDGWLNGHLTEQQRADMAAADLVRAARAHMRGGRMLTDANVLRRREARHGDLTRLSVFAAAPAAKTAVPAAKRADAIIQNAAGTPKPLDAFARTLTRVTGLNRLTAATHGLGARLLDWITPERVKAGIVSDYGVPEAVIDQRAMMQGRQRDLLRKTGHLLEKLTTMTRAESRVAYEWMNGEDTRTGDELMKELPEESANVLREVRQMVDDLSREAVRLGQLEPETYKRHRFAYLRRSYFKHAQELTGAEKAARTSAISILGDQYKGRGIVQAVPMRQIQAAAPEWWQRKVVVGKADTSLKGAKLERLERRAPSGEGTAALEGIGGEKRPGRLLEVHFWPAGEPKPAKYADWTSAGVFEARSTKGGDVVMWRDFTKEERQRMGEIDEARYAIAKTLQRMIHDVEVGRYLEWLAQNYGKYPGEAISGRIVEASERYRDVFLPGDWVQVPDTSIPGTAVKKFGKLAGMYLPGPIWNDLRQVAGGQRIGPDWWRATLGFWKKSKTAWSPTVHTNNVMSNFVMADWHDVSAGHVAKALRIVLAASDRNGKGVLGRAGNVAGQLGIADREAARAILERYENSGGAIGGWVTQELANEQLAPIVEALQRELTSVAASKAGPAEIGVFSALQHAMHLRFPQAAQAFGASRPAKMVGTEAQSMLDLYQAEDDVFRLAAWLKAKEDGASDADAGKAARKSFLDYSINAPWIQAMRQTAFPFISFVYRALPMLIDTAAKKPHKLLKLVAIAATLNALGSMLAGGDDDDDDKVRKMLPDEKAGGIWGAVPKLIRMPWNDAHGSPVFLDIRRWIPVGDVFDLGQGHSALPVPPALLPGGPLALIGELALNRSMFTGKPITLETDTATEHAAKMVDYLWKAFAPNIVALPGTHAWTGASNASKGATDAFGREQSVPQALASSVGIKLASYPPDVLRRNLSGQANAQIAEIDDAIRQLRRQRMTNRIDQDEFEAEVRAQQEKKRRIMDDLLEKVD